MTAQIIDGKALLHKLRQDFRLQADTLLINDTLSSAQRRGRNWGKHWLDGLGCA